MWTWLRILQLRCTRVPQPNDVHFTMFCQILLFRVLYRRHFGVQRTHVDVVAQGMIVPLGNDVSGLFVHDDTSVFVREIGPGCQPSALGEVF